MVDRIAPCLWFDTQAAEAAAFYVSLFPNSQITDVMERDGAVLTVRFTLEDREYIGLNGGPHFKFNEAISLFVHCETQAEIDRLWAALTEGGEEGQCGWLKDRYGLSWQIVPTVLGDLLAHPDPAVAQRKMAAMLSMRKFDIRALRDA